MEKATPKKAAAKKGTAKNLDNLFEDSIKDIYWAEKALTKALPKMAKNATEPSLKEALQGHLEETKNQIQRLEQVFQTIDKKPQAKKCDAMEGILKEGDGILEETEAGSVRDAGIIAACQKVEHYEIATYGTLVAFADQLGNKEASKLLAETLKEEYGADDKLSGIAKTVVNKSADK